MEMNDGEAAGSFSFAASRSLSSSICASTSMRSLLGNSLLIETVEQILKLMLDAAAVLQQIAFQLCKRVR
jgi:hypothetical protein